MQLAVIELEPERPTKWVPDPALPDAAMAGRIQIDQLSLAERGWLVAVLTARNVNTDDIAAKLRCSRRLIQQIRCEPVAALTTSLLKAQSEARQTAKRAQAVQIECAVGPYRAEIARLKAANGRLIDQMGRRNDCSPVFIGVPIILKKRQRSPRPPTGEIPLF